MSPRETKKEKQKDVRFRIACFTFDPEDGNIIFSETSIEQSTIQSVLVHVSGFVAVSSLVSLIL
jgi:hypothetical protein